MFELTVLESQARRGTKKVYTNELLLTLNEVTLASIKQAGTDCGKEVCCLRWAGEKDKEEGGLSEPYSRAWDWGHGQTLTNK